MQKRLGRIYGWENVKIVIDYLEAIGAPYSVTKNWDVWLIVYELSDIHYVGLQEYKQWKQET